MRFKQEKEPQTKSGTQIAKIFYFFFIKLIFTNIADDIKKVQCIKSNLMLVNDMRFDLVHLN